MSFCILRGPKVVIPHSLFLILFDPCTKWMEVFLTSSAIIAYLHSTFAHFVLCFTSEFKPFLKYLEICHLTVTSYHPQSNGLAESCVQIFKSIMRKIKNGTIDDWLSKLLFSYCNTPHSTIGRTSNRNDV